MELGPLEGAHTYMLELRRSKKHPCQRQIRRLARRSGLSTTFRPAMMYDAFARLEDDEEFRARHGGLVARLHHLLKRTRVLGALRHVPPALATPMAFECRRVDS